MRYWALHTWGIVLDVTHHLSIDCPWSRNWMNSCCLDNLPPRNDPNKDDWTASVGENTCRNSLAGVSNTCRVHWEDLRSSKSARPKLATHLLGRVPDIALSLSIPTPFCTQRMQQNCDCRSKSQVMIYKLKPACTKDAGILMESLASNRN